MSDVVILNQCIFGLNNVENTCLPAKAWLRALQTQQLHAFLQRGFPTRREEKWKYTNVQTLSASMFTFPQSADASASMQKNHHLVITNGHSSTTSANLPQGMILCSISQALNEHEALIKPYLQKPHDAKEHPFASLNTALMTDGFFLYIPKNTVVTDPINILFSNSQAENAITSPCNIIVAEANSEITLVEEYAGADHAYFTNAVTTIHAEKNAKITYHKLQNESLQATHIANLFITQKQDSVVNCFNLTTGAHLAREDVHVVLQERAAECNLYGFYYLKHDLQHADHHLHVAHAAEKSTSKMIYKGILDKKSRAVFNGKVHVQQHAQQIIAHQENHNLLLSNDAEINTKPELEIYAHDVKCTHGATIGQLDAEALFYLQARGIPKSLAMILLTHAFADEMLNKINHPDIKKRVQKQVGQHED